MFRNDEGEERFEDIFDDRNNKSEPSLSQEEKFMKELTSLHFKAVLVSTIAFLGPKLTLLMSEKKC